MSTIICSLVALGYLGSLSSTSSSMNTQWTSSRPCQTKWRLLQCAHIIRVFPTLLETNAHSHTSALGKMTGMMELTKQGASSPEFKRIYCFWTHESAAKRWFAIVFEVKPEVSLDAFGCELWWKRSRFIRRSILLIVVHSPLRYW